MTDITQSPGDRLRFEIILKFLNEGGANLAVLSEHESVLDFYAKLIEERLHAAGQTQVEFCFSTSSERLVQKFNEILSELTVEQALDKDKKHSPRRYLVFRDSILMQDFELQLLARLVNGFPASNIRVILLINSAGRNRAKLEAFGKNLLQWEVETQPGDLNEPTWDLPPDNVPVLTAAVTAPGDETAQASDSPALPEVSREPQLLGSVGMASSAPQAEQPQFKRLTRKMAWGWISLILLVSGTAAGFMHRDLVTDAFAQFQHTLVRSSPAPASEPASVMASAPDEAASAVLAAVSEVASAASDAASLPVATMPPVVPASAALQGTSVPEDAWVRELPDASYVVQLSAFDTEEDMQSFKRSSALYAKARILQARKKESGKLYFILIAGPFASKGEADTFMQSSPLLSQGWLRTVKSLKTQLPRS